MALSFEKDQGGKVTVTQFPSPLLVYVCPVVLHMNDKSPAFPVTKDRFSF